MPLSIIARVLTVLMVAVVACTIFVAATFAVYFMLGSPLRRQERARFFLDLLERGLSAGQSPERTIVELSESGDTALGMHFHRLAAYIKAGLPFRDALQRVPDLVPPQVAATLRVGEQLGDLRKVAPACRKMLVSGSSRVTSAVNYLFAVVLLTNPFVGGVLPYIAVVIAPKVREIAAEFANDGVSQPWQVLFHYRWPLFAFQALLTIVLAVLVVSYAMGPKLIRWFGPFAKTVADTLAWRLPWKRKRLLRDFSSMLSLLLDAGLPERDAVTLAATSTDNGCLSRRADLIVQRLHEGVPLQQAVVEFDDTGEFCWRLTNAAQGHGGFLRALAGWHETLEAQAYQQEQAVSQIVTTGLVVLNGVFVALVATGLFQTLTSIITRLSLW